MYKYGLRITEMIKKGASGQVPAVQPMKAMRKRLGVLLALLMLITAFPASAWATAWPALVNDKYTLSAQDGSYALDGNVTKPVEITGTGVTLDLGSYSVAPDVAGSAIVVRAGASATIRGAGAVSAGTGGKAIVVESGATCAVQGGVFNDGVSCAGSMSVADGAFKNALETTGSGAISVSGGVFATAPAAGMIAAGKAVVALTDATYRFGVTGTPAVTVTPSATTKTYDGSGVELTAAFAPTKIGANGTDYTVDIAYSWKKSGTIITGATTNAYTTSPDVTAGAVTYSAYVTSNGAGYSGTATVTVNKKSVTVAAKNRTITVGAAAPSLASPVKGSDYEISPDALSSLVTQVALKYQKNGADATPDTSSAGTYDIVPSATLTDTEHYELVKQNGTLTVTTRPTYTVSVATGIAHGSVSVDKTSAAAGETVTVTATPASGYALDAIKTTPALTVTNNTFVMPSEDVSVTATFKTAPLTGRVDISGTLRVDRMLTATLVNSNSTGTLTYQWKADGSNISGATSRTYYLTERERGKRITCTVTSTAPAGSITSSPTAAVGSASWLTGDIWLEESHITMYVGESGYLTARNSSGIVYNEDLYWRSSNTNVITVDVYGRYYAEGTGSAVIYATPLDGGSGDYCNVSVVRGSGSSSSSRSGNNINPIIPPANSQNQTTNGQSNLPTIEGIKRVTTERDGSTQTITTSADGSSSIVQTDGVGRVLSAAMTCSQSAVQSASWSGSAITLPAQVRAAYSVGGAPELHIIMPQVAQSVKVKIPVENMTNGTVAIIEKAFGPDEIVKTATSLSDGLTISLYGSAVVKVVDNTRSFYDVASSAWFAGPVAWAASRGVMNGVSEHMFDPDARMTRAMMAQILYNFDGAESTNVTNAFSDVRAKDWYGKSVTWASDNGIAHISGDRFGANDDLTREDMASMLYNYARKRGYNTAASGNLTAFSDYAEVSDWARPAMSWAVGAGLINGVGNGQLAPQGTATRAQLSSIMQRFCENAAR